MIENSKPPFRLTLLANTNCGWHGAVRHNKSGFVWFHEQTHDFKFSSLCRTSTTECSAAKTAQQADIIRLCDLCEWCDESNDLKYDPNMIQPQDTEVSGDKHRVHRFLSERSVSKNVALLLKRNSADFQFYLSEVRILCDTQQYIFSMISMSLERSFEELSFTPRTPAEPAPCLLWEDFLALVDQKPLVIENFAIQN